jgi:predicted dehydrogenase
MEGVSARGLRGVLIGYGFIGQRGHAPCYRDPDSGFVLEAIADVTPARLELARTEFPGVRTYSTWAEMFERERDLDFVDICAPPVDHGPIALAAFAKGLHVLCEKPLAWSLPQAREMLAGARAARRVLFPCHNYLHAPVVRAVGAALAEGKVGTIGSLTLDTFRNTHAKGVPEWNTNWRRERSISGGGIAMDHGSHTLYLAFDWLRSYPTSVSARIFNSQPGRYDTEDDVAAVFTFPSGLAHCHLTWTAGMRKVVYTVQGSRGGLLVNDDELEIDLQRETSGPDVAQGAVRWEIEKRSIASHWMDAGHTAWFGRVFEDFRRAIVANDFVSKTSLEGYRCIEGIDGIYRSAAQGGREVALMGPP